MHGCISFLLYSTFPVSYITIQMSYRAHIFLLCFPYLSPGYTLHIGTYCFSYDTYISDLTGHIRYGYTFLFKRFGRMSDACNFTLGRLKLISCFTSARASVSARIWKNLQKLLFCYFLSCFSVQQVFNEYVINFCVALLIF